MGGKQCHRSVLTPLLFPPQKILLVGISTKSPILQRKQIFYLWKGFPTKKVQNPFQRGKFSIVRYSIVITECIVCLTWLAMSGFVSVGYTPQTPDICVCRRHVATCRPPGRRHSVKSALFFADEIVSGNCIPDTIFYV